MDIDRVVLVVCLTVFIVVGLNASIYAFLRRGSGAAQIDLFRKAAGRARQPWITEDQALQELSDRVTALREPQLSAEENPPSEE